MHLVGAGLMTTFRVLQAFIALLADPDYTGTIQMMRRQIDSVIGKDKQPRLEHKSQLPMIEAAMFEMLRYISQTPILVPHVTMTDTKLGGYSIPRGTMIWPNVFNLHHDHRYWEEPWTFRPERFLDSNGEVVPPDHINR